MWSWRCKDEQRHLKLPNSADWTVTDLSGKFQISWLSQIALHGDGNCGAVLIRAQGDSNSSYILEATRSIISYHWSSEHTEYKTDTKQLAYHMLCFVYLLLSLRFEITKWPSINFVFYSQVIVHVSYIGSSYCAKQTVGAPHIYCCLKLQETVVYRMCSWLRKSRRSMLTKRNPLAIWHCSDRGKRIWALMTM